ncbi:MORN repeat-containing protein 4 homolog [Melanaphis sacchari]|uniref:MORN repeat-containing protein 4 n=1 Tax=Melanaphis sacchari TaxID=742174 RepID=A0A2H8TMD5_9HEMI|nr:MORN repeat-containing protein 4 homolog [Melanaphis sacchari]
MQPAKVTKFGAYVYEDGSKYIGDWNDRGRKHGLGHVQLKDNTRYEGGFSNGLCSGLGVLQYPDGARYEGEFMEGWFHGHGMFWRADGMKYEGQFRGGRIWGLGLITFKDGSHGLPRHEGFFKDCKFVQKKKCPRVVVDAQRAALMARIQTEQT